LTFENSYDGTPPMGTTSIDADSATAAAIARFPFYGDSRSVDGLGERYLHLAIATEMNLHKRVLESVSYEIVQGNSNDGAVLSWLLMLQHNNLQLYADIFACLILHGHVELQFANPIAHTSMTHSIVIEFGAQYYASLGPLLFALLRRAIAKLGGEMWLRFMRIPSMVATPGPDRQLGSDAAAAFTAAIPTYMATFDYFLTCHVADETYVVALFADLFHRWHISPLEFFVTEGILAVEFVDSGGWKLLVKLKKYGEDGIAAAHLACGLPKFGMSPIDCFARLFQEDPWMMCENAVFRAFAITVARWFCDTFPAGSDIWNATNEFFISIFPETDAADNELLHGLRFLLMRAIFCFNFTAFINEACTLRPLIIFNGEFPELEIETAPVLAEAVRILRGPLIGTCVLGMQLGFNPATLYAPEELADNPRDGHFQQIAALVVNDETACRTPEGLFRALRELAGRFGLPPGAHVMATVAQLNDSGDAAGDPSCCCFIIPPETLRGNEPIEIAHLLHPYLENDDDVRIIEFLASREDGVQEIVNYMDRKPKGALFSGAPISTDNQTDVQIAEAFCAFFAIPKDERSPSHAGRPVAVAIDMGSGEFVPIPNTPYARFAMRIGVEFDFTKCVMKLEHPAGAMPRLAMPPPLG
jgi:hypothetical protein